MSALNSGPATINQLQGTKFLVEFRRFPNMQYWAQNFFVPGVTLSEAIQSNPFADIRRAGDKISLDPLTLTFVLDAELRAWTDIFDWMKGIGKMKNMKDRTEVINKSQELMTGSVYSDVSLTILSASNNPRISFVFRNAWPSTLSTFTMTSTDSAETTITTDCTFYYDYFDIDRSPSLPAFSLA